MIANDQVETRKSPVELKFEVADIKFYKIFVVMEKLIGSVIGLMFLQRNHTVLDMRQGILKIRYFSMHFKTTRHKYSNVMERILNPEDVTTPRNDPMIVTKQSQLYTEYAVTGILQPSERNILRRNRHTDRRKYIVNVSTFTDKPDKRDCILHFSQ